ncbi:MAG: hypothetical protein M3R07_04650, partial [Gemmatimonadota bacterium]|nr:hypothetical protein [Gemmatimonadota bacterium]
MQDEHFHVHGVSKQIGAEFVYDTFAPSPQAAERQANEASMYVAQVVRVLPGQKLATTARGPIILLADRPTRTKKWHEQLTPRTAAAIIAGVLLAPFFLMWFNRESDKRFQQGPSPAHRRSEMDIVQRD